MSLTAFLLLAGHVLPVPCSGVADYTSGMCKERMPDEDGNAANGSPPITEV